MNDSETNCEQLNGENQQCLFGKKFNEPFWKKHWKDMPEFIQNDESPYKSIIINFISKLDVEEFSELIKQNITENTKSLWFPQFDREPPLNYLYVHKDNLDIARQLSKKYES